jgi:ferredoxin
VYDACTFNGIGEQVLNTRKKQSHSVSHLVPKVDKELCISCGNCVELCPDVFVWDDEGKAEVTNPGGCSTQCNCQEAAESCPTDAILLEE